jgi:hypothetical protein
MHLHILCDFFLTLIVTHVLHLIIYAVNSIECIKAGIHIVFYYKCMKSKYIKLK